MANESKPWFKFNPTAFLADPKVHRMPTAQVGAYVLLLCHAWNDRGLPGEVEELAFLANVDDPDEFRVMWDGLLGRCWKLEEDGRYYNSRQEKERGEAEAKSEQASNAGKKSAEARKGKRKPVERTGTDVQRDPTTVERPSNGSERTSTIGEEESESERESEEEGQQRACAHTREAPPGPSQPNAGRPTDPGPPEEESPPEALRRPGVRAAVVSRADADTEPLQPPEPTRALPGRSTPRAITEALPDLETHRPADVSAETWSSWLQAVEAQTFGLRQIHRVETRVLHEGMARALVQVYEGRGLGEDWTKLPTAAERMAAMVSAKSRNRSADSPVSSVVEWLTDLDDRAKRSKRGSRSYIRKALQGGPDPAEAVVPATTPPTPAPDPTHDPYPKA